MARKKEHNLDGVEISGGNRSTPVDQYEVKSHMNTLMEAEEIKGDPMKMKHVKKLMKKHKKHFRSIADVKKYAQDTYGGVGGKPKDHGAEEMGETKPDKEDME